MSIRAAEAADIVELVKAEPDHLVVLPAERAGRYWWSEPTQVWVLCHASIDEAGEYDLRPIAELVGPNQRLRFDEYRNPLYNIKEGDT